MEILKRGVVDLHVEADLIERLKKGRPLKIKAGFDPTRPDLHLGHTVLMNKMRDFQDLGHEVIFVVGDFTAQIGDPSGRNVTRPPLSKSEIRAAAETYASQAFKILDKTKTRLEYNSEWLSKIAFEDVIRLAGKYTLARMMEREDFKTRYAEHVSISLHELLYPLAQAYDSVHLECDVELGGSDQLFNLLVGREIMREYNLAPQIVMTMPLLEGLSARLENGRIIGDKMSKSLDNYVGIDEPSEVQFGKLMSISDDLMWRYYSLLSSKSPSDIAVLKGACENGSVNPKEAKVSLAIELISRYHPADEAKKAHATWEAQFSERKAPEDMPIWSHQGEVPLMQALAKSGTLESASEARRRIQQGGIYVDGQKVSDIQHKLAPRPAPYEIKAGKRAWVRINIT